MLRMPHSGFVRIQCLEPCQVEDSAGRRAGVVWNVSVRGVYVVINPVPPAGERLWLSFQLRDEQDPIRSEGRVAWRNPPSLKEGIARKAMNLPAGCGIEFVALRAGDRRRIDSHVRAAVSRTGERTRRASGGSAAPPRRRRSRPD